MDDAHSRSPRTMIGDTVAATTLGALMQLRIPSLAAFIAALTFVSMDSLAQTDTRLPVEGMLPPLTGATAWLNSPALTPDSLRGKVVLVGFLTYTCINWQRTQ